MFVAHVRRLDQFRAEQMLDALQVNAAPNLRKHDYRSFVDRLVARCTAALADVAEDIAEGAQQEAVVWNGKVLGTARAIKSKVAEVFGRGAL